MKTKRSKRICFGCESRNVSPRCGFSLLELILVLAVLIAFAAMTMPTIHRTIAQQSLVKGADLLRASMGRARVKAIKTGDIHAVFYMPDTGFLTVAPFNNYQQVAEQSQAKLRLLENAGRIDFDDELLPTGIRFAAGEVKVSSRDTEAFSGQGGQNVRPILFYPDGTSQNAKIILQNEKGAAVQVSLRGLTGTSTSIKFDDQRRQR